MQKLVLTILALTALLGGGPVHMWFHHVELVSFDGVQLHGEHCSHFSAVDDHADDCGLCAASRVVMATPQAPPASQAEPRLELQPEPDDPRVVCTWARRVLGARAPPVIG